MRAAGWRPSRLKFLATTRAGGTPDVANLDYWADADDEDGIAWVAIADMTREPRLRSTSRFVTPAGMTAGRLTVGQPGTLLFAMYASLGTMAVLERPAAWNQAILGITARSGSLIDYVRYALEDARKDLLSRARSNTQANLNQEQVGNLPILAPSLAAQRHVADFLDRECERIAEAMSAADALDVRATALERDALIAALAPLPESKLAYRFEVQLGKMLDGAREAPAEERLAYLRNVNVQWGRIDTHDLKRMPFSTSEQRKFALIPGDLLVCEGGEVGRAAVWRGQVAHCYYQKALHRVRPRSGDSTEFLQWSLRYIALTRGFQADSTGSAIPHLPADRLRELRVPTADREQQNEIVARMNRISEALSASRDAGTTLRSSLVEYRDSLIHEAVTGKIDVSRASEAQMGERLHAATGDRLNEVA